MNKDQYDKFEKFWNDGTESREKTAAKCAWFACLEANGIGEEPRIPEGYFKIGEYVEINHDHLWRKGKVIVIPSGSHVAMLESISPEYVRRIPAWKPKDGDAVLFEFSGYAQSGVYKQGSVYAGNQSFHYAMPMKPFDETNRGKPWSEI